MRSIRCLRAKSNLNLVRKCLLVDANKLESGKCISFPFKETIHSETFI